MPRKARHASAPPGEAARGFRVRYSEPVAREICERIAAGESWVSFAGRGRMPCRTTMYLWCERYPVFAEAIAQAREIARDRELDPAAEPSRPAIFDSLTPQEMRRQMDEDEPHPPRYGTPGRNAPDRYGRVSYVRFRPEVADAICDRLAAGEPISRICNSPGFPSRMTVEVWKRSRPQFAAMAEQAVRIAGETRFDEAYEVAMASTHETVHSDKVRVGLLMRQAEKLDPDRYGSQPRGGAAGPTRMIVVRHFERARREDGTEYVRAIDDVQQVEDPR